MTDLPSWRQRYAQILVVCILGGFLLVMSLSVGNGPAQFESSLWGRSSLITLFTTIRLALKDRVFPEAVIGKDGWMDYTSSNNLDDYQNSLPFSPNYAQGNAQTLYGLLQSRHITLVIIIAPNKETIYPEAVPDEIPKINPQSRLDLLTAYFKQYGPPVLIDLRPALEAARNGPQALYYKTDSHWSALGAFVAYTQVMNFLSRTYPELTPQKIQDFRFEFQKPVQLDIPRTLSAPGLLEQPVFLTAKSGPVYPGAGMTLNSDDFPTRIWTTSNERLPTLLMFHDSFGTAMLEFLVPHFRETVYIQNTSDYADLKSFDFIKQVNPDVVIIEVVERNLAQLGTFLYGHTISGPVK